MLRTIAALGSALLVVMIARAASAATYQIGPTRTLKTLQAVQATLKPGDVVEVDGDATYPGGVFFKQAQSGSPTQKVTIRGLKVNGKRPVISGGGTGTTAGLGMVLNGSHYVLESLEVTAASSMCIVHKADDVTITDFVVHDCPGQGLLGHDDEAGSLTLQHSEFFKNGEGDKRHQIYMTTGQEMYPGAVFRMQHCYVHDGTGGNNVKTRSQRNEIYYNWIEGAYYHNLELIGPDKDPATPAREDSDVVGNVIVGNGSQGWHLVRAGGDQEESDTSGRYRFVNNTFVVRAAGNSSIVRLMLRVDTVEMHNNLFVRSGAGAAPIFSMGEVDWVNGASIFGSNNWVQDGFTGTPATWTNTITGANAGLIDIATLDVRLKSDSPLIDKAVANPASVAGREFPNPLAAPAFVPPTRVSSLAPAPRSATGALDIGAYEFGTGSTPGTPADPDAGSGNGNGNGNGDGGNGAGNGDGSGNGAGGGSGNGPGGDDASDGCAIRGTRDAGTVASLAFLGVMTAVTVRRRRRG